MKSLSIHCLQQHLRSKPEQAGPGVYILAAKCYSAAKNSTASHRPARQNLLVLVSKPAYQVEKCKEPQPTITFKRGRLPYGKLVTCIRPEPNPAHAPKMPKASRVNHRPTWGCFPPHQPFLPVVALLICLRSSGANFWLASEGAHHCGI